jgi:hypothetical protein
MWRWCVASLLIALFAYALWPRREKSAISETPKPPQTTEKTKDFSSWGSDDTQLGRTEANESNPEGPMSFAMGMDGALWVLDQANGRLVRKKRGEPPRLVPLTMRAPQDLALTKSGDVVVLDRLGDRRVDVLSATGEVKTSLPVEGAHLEEGGAVTALLTDGDEIYLEHAHGMSVHIGNVSGPSHDRHERLGRPMPNGTTWLSAGISDRLAGAIYVTATNAETGAQRFTREVRFGRPVDHIRALFGGDDDVIYVAARVNGTDTFSFVRVLCLRGDDGAHLGHVDLPESPLADEVFRDLSPAKGAGVVYAYRDESGVSYAAYQCPKASP